MNGIRKTAGDACATIVVMLPLALLALVFGGKALVWVLTHLPQG